MANDLVIRIGASLKGLQESLGVANRQLNRFAAQAESVGRDLSTRLTLPIVGVGAAAVRAFGSFDQLEKGLTAVAGGSEQAQEQLGRLQKIALEPGISLEQAVKGSIRLQSVGFAAQEAEATLLQFSKAVTLAGGSAEDLDEVSRQLAQITSKGKLLAEDVSVIQERVPAIGIALQQAFGTQNVEAIRATGVSARDFVTQVTNAIATNQKFQSVQGGINNSLDNFRQSITASLAALGKSIVTTLNLESVLNRISSAILRAVQGFQSLSPQVQSIIVKVGLAVAAIGPLSFALGAAAKVLPIVTAGLRVLAVSFSALFSPITIVVGAVALTGKLLFDLYQRSEVFRGSVGRLFDSVRALGAQLASNFSGALSVAGKILGFIGEQLGKVGINTKTVAAFFAGLANAIVSSLTAAVKLLTRFVAGLADLVSFDLQGAGQNFKAAFNEAFGLATGRTAGQAFVDGYREALQPNKVAQAVAPAAKAASAAAAAAFAPATQVAVTGGGSAGGGSGRGRASALSGIASGSARFGAGNLEQLTSGVQATLDKLNIETALNGIRDAGLEITAAAVNPLTALGQAFEVVDAKAAVFGGTYDGLQEKINLTTQALNAAIESGWSPTSNVVTALNEQLATLQAQTQTVGIGIQGVASGIAEVADVFDSLAQRGISSFQEFSRGAIKAIREVLSATIKLGVANAVANSLKNVATINPFLIPVIAGAAGALASGAFNSILNSLKIPALAEGGFVNKPTLALIGEDGPEAVVPLDRMGDFGGSGEFVLRGDDLLLIMNRALARQNRIR